MAQRKFYNIPEGEKEIVQTTVSHYKWLNKKKKLRKHKDPNVYRCNIYIYKCIYKSLLKWHVKKENKGFPGGSVVKNPPINASRHGFDPWSGKILHGIGAERKSHSLGAHVLQVLKHPCPRTPALQHERTPQQEGQAPQQRSPWHNLSTFCSDESRTFNLGEVVSMGYNQPQWRLQRTVVIEETL